MDDEDYDILPHSEVLRLKHEILDLKGGKTPQESAGLQQSIDALNISIRDMITLFKTAGDDIKAEDFGGTETSDVAKKLDTLINHNEDMAKALLLLLELSREHLPKLSTGVKQASSPVVPPAETFETAFPATPPDFPPLDFNMPEAPKAIPTAAQRPRMPWK